jgi:hypothetical protein
VSVAAAEWIVRLLAMYAAVGVLFAIAFTAKGLTIDPAAKASGLGFRVIIMPGAALLWPVLAWKWSRR